MQKSDLNSSKIPAKWALHVRVDSGLTYWMHVTEEFQYWMGDLSWHVDSCCTGGEDSPFQARGLQQIFSYLGCHQKIGISDMQVIDQKLVTTFVLAQSIVHHFDAGAHLHAVSILVQPCMR